MKETKNCGYSQAALFAILTPSSNFCTAYFLTGSVFLTCSCSAFSGLSIGSPSRLFVIIYLSLLIYLFSLPSSSTCISREKGIHCALRWYVSVSRTVSDIGGAQSIFDHWWTGPWWGSCYLSFIHVCDAFQALEY